MATVFYEKNGVTVSDSAFINSAGNQYPIRNITSIEIKEKINSPIGIIILGGILLAIGIVIINSAGIGIISGILTALGIIFLLGAKTAALNSSKIELLIGGGGTPQTGMSLPFKDPNSKLILDEIAKAIGESISNLQKT